MCLEWVRAVLHEGGKVRVEAGIPAISWTANTGLFSPDFAPDAVFHMD